MSENQENKKGIIDSYDGDPDDLVFFQPLDVEEEDEDFEESWEAESYEEFDDAESEGEVQEEIILNPATEKLISNHQPKQPVLNGDAGGTIDLNDPHYVNYEPDPYYEYGYGPEPEAKKEEDKKDGSALGITSLCTGIGSMLFGCCGMSYILSIAALITGIWCLCLKSRWNSYKTMAVIGVVCALIPFLLMILGVSSQILIDILSNI